MTRKLLCALGLVGALTLGGWVPARAQQSVQTPAWDAPVTATTPEEKPPVTFRLDDWFAEQKEKYGFGGYGGPLAMYVQLDFSALDPMTHDRGLGRFDPGVLFIGGLGGMVLHPPDWPGYLTFGGVGFGASQSLHETVGSDHRSAAYTLGGGGLYGEYRQPLVSSLDLVAGVMVGAGGLTLEADGHDLGLVDDNDFHASTTFFLTYPYLGLSWGLTKWMRIEASGGWLYMNPDLDTHSFHVHDSGMDMTDGSVNGGPQASLSLVFGWWARPQ